jgi:hypothetical protein
MPITNDEFRQKPLSVHQFLTDVPLHDLWVIHLKGGGEGRTLQDLLRIVNFGDFENANRIVSGLFKLRWRIGRALGWDKKPIGVPAASYLHRLTPAERERSLVAPGSADGPFRLMYRYENESLGELINATVHAFALTAMEATPDGYTVYLGVYVKKVHRLTPVYMALIDPFRKLFVYPAIIRKMERTWAAAYAHA